MGAGRRVYDLGDYVLKLPLNFEKPHRHTKDAQSIYELKVFQNCPEDLRYLLCPVYDYYCEQGILILIMPKMETLDVNEVMELQKQRNEGESLLEVFCRTRGIECKQMVIDSLRLCQEMNLSRMDLLESGYNWGFKGDTIQYIDYGYELENNTGG